MKEPFKIGDRVHHKGVCGTVVNTNEDRVFVRRNFNCSGYWDRQDYWAPITEDTPSVSRLESVFLDQGESS